MMIYDFLIIELVHELLKKPSTDRGNGCSNKYQLIIIAFRKGKEKGFVAQVSGCLRIAPERFQDFFVRGTYQ
jgi:hypothetical protein